MDKIRLTRLEPYSDDRGNVVEFTGEPVEGVSITFSGENNRLTVTDPIRIGTFRVQFDSSNGTMTIGPCGPNGVLRLTAQLGQDSSIVIGRKVTATSAVLLSAVEGTAIRIGEDVMFAKQCQVRGDDAHPIFDVRTERRVNVSRDITIGNHVWVGFASVVLGGARIDDGSVIGMNSLVKSHVPNNCIAVGTPARVTRRDIAWERPHLSRREPFYKPDASTVRKSPYWALTEREPGRLRKTYHRLPAGLRRAIRRLVGRAAD